jgi:hypothetical protein
MVVDFEPWHVLKEHEEEFEISNTRLGILHRDERVICVLQVGNAPWDQVGDDSQVQEINCTFD